MSETHKPTKPSAKSVTITHPEKVLFPDADISKGDVAAYYELVAVPLLLHLRGRPLTMERYPSGIDQGGFLQKNVGRGAPTWLQVAELPKQGGVVRYPVINDADGLRWMANQNCITPHIPVSRVPHLMQPDLCVFDLDPAQDDPDVLQMATLAVRDLLLELGLPSWVKTSGSKGFHVVAPLDGSAGFEELNSFADAVAALLVRRHPEQLTQEFMKADRAGRIFVDIGRNGFGATFAAPYSLRARAGAPVSAPCTWAEIEEGAVGPQTFTLRTMRARLAETGDLWNDLGRHRHSLRRPLERALKLLGSDGERRISQGERRVAARRQGHADWAANRRGAGDAP